MTDTLPDQDRKRSGRRFAAVAVFAVLALGACTSDPGVRRVAQDIIKAEAEANPELDEECMLGALDDFTDSDLEAITDQLSSANEDSQAEGQAALDDYEAALSACN
ncbi:MAG: hypothetical protein WA964_17865 [Ilumatobacter sp.]|uniref:hypothetical protein n=1 Tax=Ilumatobacter sp. TaxID=1967498 RepID=UPI003C781340